uniref:Uncharacterized protein n=1 Tax=Arundo donax TaxID=35708 RepID=A0A0A9AU08_ARUDO
MLPIMNILVALWISLYPELYTYLRLATIKGVTLYEIVTYG